jgi:hypothetical protein
MMQVGIIIVHSPECSYRQIDRAIDLIWRKRGKPIVGAPEAGFSAILYFAGSYLKMGDRTQIPCRGTGFTLNKLWISMSQ